MCTTVNESTKIYPWSNWDLSLVKLGSIPGQIGISGQIGIYIVIFEKGLAWGRDTFSMLHCYQLPVHIDSRSYTDDAVLGSPVASAAWAMYH